MPQASLKLKTSGIRKQNSSPPKRACRSWSPRLVRCLAFPGQQIIGSNLLGENAGNTLDDSIAHEMADRVVVPFEVRDVDQADRAPLMAPFEPQKPFESLHEPREMQERGLGIAARLIGQLGQHVFEGFGHLLVAGRGELTLQPGHLLDEALGLRVKRFQLRILDPVALSRDDRFRRQSANRLLRGPGDGSVRGPTGAVPQSTSASSSQPRSSVCAGA